MPRFAKAPGVRVAVPFLDKWGKKIILEMQ
jgi:hypothetical protein